jgi:hypothetical protein
MNNEEYTFFNFLEDVSKKTSIKILPYTSCQVMLMLSLAEQENILISKERRTGTTFLLILYALWQALHNKKRVFYITKGFSNNTNVYLLNKVLDGLVDHKSYVATHYRYKFGEGEISFLHSFSKWQSRSSNIVIVDEIMLDKDCLLGLLDMDCKIDGLIVTCERDKRKACEELLSKKFSFDVYEMIEEAAGQQIKWLTQ